MGYAVEFAKSAERSFRKLDDEVRRQLAQCVESLVVTPRPKGAVKLGDIDGHGCYRVRSGSYRVIYVVMDDVLLVLVTRTGHRREVYSRFREIAQRAVRSRRRS